MIPTNCYLNREPGTATGTSPASPWSWMLLAAWVLAAPVLADTDGAEHGLEAFDQPWPEQHFEFKSQGQDLTMSWMLAEPDGEAANGRTALLLHGKNFCAAYWESTARHLTEAGYRVIMPEQVGFCRSSLPERYQFSFHQLVANTARLLDDQGIDQVDVIGHSMGGMMGVRMALLEPERVDRLVLVNPIGLEDWLAEGVPYPGIDALHAGQKAQDADRIRKYQKESYYDGDWNEEYAYWAGMLATTYEGPRGDRVAWNHALTADMVLTQPVVHEFGRLETPTTLIIGLRDRTAIGRDQAEPEVAEALGNYPELGRRAAEAMPRAELIELDDVGHMPQFEAPERYLEALDAALDLEDYNP